MRTSGVGHFWAEGLGRHDRHWVAVCRLLVGLHERCLGLLEVLASGLDHVLMDRGQGRTLRRQSRRVLWRARLLLLQHPVVHFLENTEFLDDALNDLVHMSIEVGELIQSTVDLLLIDPLLEASVFLFFLFGQLELVVGDFDLLDSVVG